MPQKVLSKQYNTGNKKNNESAMRLCPKLYGTIDIHKITKSIFTFRKYYFFLQEIKQIRFRKNEMKCGLKN